MKCMYIGDGRSDCYQVYLIEATGFYSASVELATQSAVLAMIDSVRTSVCHSPVSGQNNSSYDHAVFTRG